MSWEVIKLADGASGAQATDRTTFVVAYYLRGGTSDTAIDAGGALVATGIPRLGDSYGASWPAALCVGIDPRTMGNGLEWLITCRYDTSPDIASGAGMTIPGDGSSDPDDDAYIGGGFPEGYDPTDPAQGLAVITDADGLTYNLSAPGADADPRKLPWQFELGNQATMRERYQLKLIDDTTGIPGALTDTAINTAGIPYRTPVMEDVYVPVIQLSKNVPSSYITPAQAASLEGSTNSTAMNIAGVSIVARQALLTGVRLRRAWFGERLTPYWEIALSIVVFEDVEKSDIWVLSRGMQQKVGGKVVNIDTTTPVLLDVNGAQTTTPYYRKFSRSNLKNWTALALPRRV